MQRGSLRKFFNKRTRVWLWRFQWREPGFKGPRTAELGRCSEISRAEARSAADQIIRRVQGFVPALRSSTISLRRFVEEVYLDVKTRKWKASTRATTEQLIKDHVLGPLGEDQLHLITRKDLQRLLDQLAREDKSYSVVAHVRWQLSAIFEMAIGDGLITVNPTNGLETPRCKASGEKRSLNLQAIRRVEPYLELRERLMLRLAVLRGLRPGEITGLKCGDITNDRINIERRVYRRIVDTPKSALSKRNVPDGSAVDKSTAAMLQEYLNIIPDASPGAWLFASENPSKPVDYSNVFRRRIKPALERAGLGWVNFQVLRRTHANELSEGERDPKVRSQLMGHSVDVHENEYREAPFKAKQRAIKRLVDRLQ